MYYIKSNKDDKLKYIAAEGRYLWNYLFLHRSARLDLLSQALAISGECIHDSIISGCPRDIG